MNIEILSKEKNDLLHRTNINFEIKDAKSIPSRIDVRQQLAALLNANEKLILVNNIDSHFGENRVSGYAKLYDSENFIKEVENEHIVKRNFPPVKEGEAAPAAAEKAGEKKADETGKAVEKPAEKEKEEEKKLEEKEEKK